VALYLVQGALGLPVFLPARRKKGIRACLHDGRNRRAICSLSVCSVLPPAHWGTWAWIVHRFGRLFLAALLASALIYVPVLFVARGTVWLGPADPGLGADPVHFWGNATKAALAAIVFPRQHGR